MNKINDNKTEFKQDLMKYIDLLNKNDVVSISHLVLRGMYSIWGESRFSTAVNDYFKRQKELFKEYKENENLNLHAENLLLLASEYGTEEDIHKAELNLKYLNKFGYRDNVLNREAYEANNNYYYKYLTA